MTSKILFTFLLFSMGYFATARQRPFDSIMPAIRYFEAHPFDSTHHKESDSLVALLKKSLPLYFDTYHRGTVLCPKGFTFAR